MSCAFARLTVWTLRRWFASDRSMRERAPLELLWIEQDLALERTRDLAIESAQGVDTTPLTSDEAAVLASLIFATWSPGAARACLAPFLTRHSAEAAVCIAARVRRSSTLDRRSRCDTESLFVCSITGQQPATAASTVRSGYIPV
jgi:hypothetical protein